MDHYPFDFDRSGELDAFERAAELQFINDVFMSDDETDDDTDFFFDDDF